MPQNRPQNRRGHANSGDAALRDLMRAASDLPPAGGLVAAAQARGLRIRRRRRMVGSATGIAAAAALLTANALLGGGNYAVTEPVVPAATQSPTTCPTTQGDPMIRNSARTATAAAIAASALAACTPASTTASPQLSPTPSATSTSRSTGSAAPASPQPSQSATAAESQAPSATAEPSASASPSATVPPSAASLPDGRYCGQITAVDAESKQVTLRRWASYTPETKKESGDVHRLDVPKRPSGGMRSGPDPARSHYAYFENRTLPQVFSMLEDAKPTLKFTVDDGNITEFDDDSVGLGGEFHKGCRLTTEE